MDAIQISNTTIRQFHGLFSLNDLHMASGSENRHKPSLWAQNKQTIKLIEEIEKAGNPAILKKQQLGTFACEELVIAYGMWISPAFALKVIRAFLGQQKLTKLTPAQKQEIREAVQQRHHRTGEHWQEIYRKLHAFLKVNSYHEIEARDFQAALDFLASIENAPAKAEPQGVFFTDKEVSQFAAATYYLDWATRQLNDLSVPLKAIGAREQGIKARTLFIESQSWLRNSITAIERVIPQISDTYSQNHVCESLNLINKLADA